MTLLIYWTLLYVHSFGAGWYVFGFLAWIAHLVAHSK
jgi:hypothetical protein